MAWSYNHKTGKSFWTENPKYISDPRIGEGFKDTGYGFKDTMVTRKHTEYSTPKEAQKAREEYLKEQQIAKNEDEARQREVNERIGKEVEHINHEIKRLRELQSRTDSAPGDYKYYERQITKLQKRLRTIT